MIGPHTTRSVIKNATNANTATVNADVPVTAITTVRSLKLTGATKTAASTATVDATEIVAATMNAIIIVTSIDTLSLRSFVVGQCNAGNPFLLCIYFFLFIKQKT